MKLFEDLPSTNTPITAEKLNQIQENLVVVSATEPTGDNREKVWMQKGKNLFDKNSGIVSGSFIGSDGSIGTDTNLFYQTVYISVMPNTIYIISSSSAENHRIAEYDEEKTFIKRNLNEKSSVSYTFTTSSNCYFIRISCNISNIDNIQIEQGTTTTSYEAYIEQKMFVKNDNGVYEEFINKDNLVNYSTGEQKIGTWINGKPLYRKVIQDTLPITDTSGTNASKEISITSSSEMRRIVDAWVIDGIKDSYPLPYLSGTGTSGYLTKCQFTNTGTLKIQNANSNFNELPVIAILEYTKTTD